MKTQFDIDPEMGPTQATATEIEIAYKALGKYTCIIKIDFNILLLILKWDSTNYFFLQKKPYMLCNMSKREPLSTQF